MTNKRFFTLLGIVLALVLGVTGYRWADSSSTVPKGSDAVVERVVDGDTIKVRLGSRKETVRFIGVDTPETVDPRRPVGCFGKEASNFTKTTLPQGMGVDLVLDAESRDKYGRLLAYVYRSSDHMFVNAELAQRGYAQQLTIPPNVSHVDEFTKLVDDARSSKRGLWNVC